MKSIDTLVEDIYLIMQRKQYVAPDADQYINDFADAMRDLMRKEFTQKGFWDGRNLRLSSIGKKDRQLWYSANGYKGEPIQAHTKIKFLYGNILEELVILLTKLAGHTVSDQQKVCHVGGVKGHQDCKIDNTLVDIKSASSYSFKKFEDGSLVEGNDPFGYQAQLDAYAYSNGVDDYAWVAIDKANGKLTVLRQKADPKIDERVEHVKEMVKGEIPERCYDDVPDGKSGNRKLGIECSYCNYKHHCWPDLRVFAYSGAPRFLTVVENEPNVPEITEGGNF